MHLSEDKELTKALQPYLGPYGELVAALAPIYSKIVSGEPVIPTRTEVIVKTEKPTVPTWVPWLIGGAAIGIAVLVILRTRR